MYIHIRHLAHSVAVGRGDDTVGNPQTHYFERFELILLSVIRQTVPCRAIRGKLASNNRFDRALPSALYVFKPSC